MPEVATRQTYTTRAVDPQVRPLRWAGKAHTREGRLFYALRAELVGHIGNPNPAQRALIDRLAWLQVHVASMDERMMKTGELSDHAGRQYLAWSNAITRGLSALGLKSAEHRAMTAAEAFAAIHAQYGQPAVGEATE